MDEQGLQRKKNAVGRALELHQNVLGNPLQVLCALGGREQAAIVGAIYCARQRSIPVMLDGYICGAAAAVLAALDKSLLDHCQFSHYSGEPGHRILLQEIGREALLELEMRLGEGSGAAIALGVLKGAVSCHNNMASFSEAAVDNKKQNE